MSVLPAPLAFEDACDGKPYSDLVGAGIFQGAGEIPHRGLAITGGEKGIAGGHQDLASAVAELLRHIYVLQNFIPLSKMGFRLRPLNVDLRILRIERQGRVESVDRFLVASLAIESIGQCELRGDVVGIFLQSDSILALRLRELSLLAKCLCSGQVPGARLPQQSFALIQLNERQRGTAKLKISVCQPEVRLSVVRAQLERCLKICNSFIGLTQIVQHEAAIRESSRHCGIALYGKGECREGFV